jgi:hypothetical protein
MNLRDGRLHNFLRTCMHAGSACACKIDELQDFSGGDPDAPAVQGQICSRIVFDQTEPGFAATFMAASQRHFRMETGGIPVALQPCGF